jgi:hypothetical protein
MLEKRIYSSDNNYKFKPLRQTVPYRILEGCEAKFVKMTNKKGVKLFWDKHSAKRSFNRQKKAYLNGLGPKVLTDSICTYGLTNDNAIYIQWGYLTEVVETFSSKKDFYFWNKENEGLDVVDVLENIETLGKQLRKLRVGGYDLHEFNVGIKNGKLVCIDFGDQSAY